MISREVDDVDRDEELVRHIMCSYARNQESQATAGTIFADIRNNGEELLFDSKIFSYLKALKEILVVEDSVAWKPNLRSKTAIRTSDICYSIDPFIAQHHWVDRRI